MELAIVVPLLVLIVFTAFLNRSGARVRIGVRQNDPFDEVFNHLPRDHNNRAKLRIAEPPADSAEERSQVNDSHGAIAAHLRESKHYQESCADEPRERRRPGDIGSVVVYTDVANERARRNGQNPS